MHEWLTLHVTWWQMPDAQDMQELLNFSILWAFFEAWISYPDTANSARICRKVNSMDEGVFGDIPDTINSYLYFRNRYFLDDGSELKFNTLYGDFDLKAKACVEAVFRQDNPSNSSVVKAVLLVINRLRNNHLHGAKALYGYEDQGENFRQANRVLMEIAHRFRG